MISNAMKNSHWLIVISSFVLCISASVNARHIQQDFDLEASAAEPRPIYIETGPAAEALPLVADPSSGPFAGASEKIEKILRPALSFSYNDNKEKEDGEIAESKYDDQKPAAVNYYKYIEAEEKKEAKGKEEAHEQDVEAGGEIAESKHHGHKHDGGHDHKDDGGDKGGGQGGEFEKGGSKEFHSHHEGEHGQKGDKGYKGHHHHEKGQKGHHDHEDHKKAYEEGGGHKKDHHHKDGYHGDHFKSHGGKKASKYAEKGEHNKGHSTKGSHSIHKKDEYEKKTEFFDEDHEGGESEKHGGFSHSDGYKKGGHQKSDYSKGGEHKEHHGKHEEGSKGGHFEDEQGHNDKEGHEAHHDHDTKYGKKESHDSGKKWAYSEGDEKGGGGGGGHGDGGHSHGAHSHQSYAVQEAPKEQVAEAAPVKTYDFPPLFPYVLPLEDEPNIEGTKSRGKLGNYETTDYLSDGKVDSSKDVRRIAKNGKKRKSTPTDDFLSEYPFGPSTTKRSSENSGSSTISPIELLIRQALISDVPKESKQEPAQTPNVEPSESKKVTKKRRLKKRKIQKKDSKTEASSRSSRALPDCIGHNTEIHVPGESSHNFVIVAADDSL